MDQESTIPNEAGVESVDNSNVIETPPAWTSETPPRETPQEEPAADEGSETTPVENAEPTEGAEGVEEDYKPRFSPEQIQQMAQAADYQPGEVEVTFVDELGNFDPAAFGQFMQENNRRVFEQALQASNARTQLTQIEQDSWAHVEKQFPEIVGNESLTKALRGARVQDVIAGGDGDLARIAKDIVAPIRESRIKAVEDVNKQVTEQKKLETFTPENNAPERQAPPLMAQLQAAIANGDTEAQTKLRHAIRKERISANNS